MEEVENFLKRPKLYDNIDGSSEMMLGCMLIGFTAYQWVGFHARRDSIWNSVYALYIFVALLITALIYGTKALKSSITYRRTGFVRYRKPHLWWLVLICSLSAVVGCGLAFLIVRKHEIDSTLFVSIGAGLFVASAYVMDLPAQLTGNGWLRRF